MMKRYGFLSFMAMLIFCLLGCSPQLHDKPTDTAGSETVPSTVTEPASSLTIKMLNVGQGDAILIRTAEQTILIDTSDADERDKLREELEKANVSVIDKVILTHPHADHIGGMDVVLKEYDVKEVYDNGMPSTSPLWRSYMKIMAKKEIQRHELKAGDVLKFGGGVRFLVYSPTAELIEQGQQKDFKHDPNNESVVGKLVYGDFAMLFTGDAEKTAEKAILTKYGGEITCDILKSPHHGSKTSSSSSYLKAVQPKVVLISVGEGNDYGHPNQETLDRYGKLGSKVYRTDQNGTITVTSDGKTYDVQEERK